jgi:hypothetical protein
MKYLCKVNFVIVFYFLVVLFAADTASSQDSNRNRRVCAKPPAVDFVKLKYEVI